MAHNWEAESLKDEIHEKEMLISIYKNKCEQARIVARWLLENRQSASNEEIGELKDAHKWLNEGAHPSW